MNLILGLRYKKVETEKDRESKRMAAVSHGTPNHMNLAHQKLSRGFMQSDFKGMTAPAGNAAMDAR